MIWRADIKYYLYTSDLTWSSFFLSFNFIRDLLNFFPAAPEKLFFAVILTELEDGRCFEAIMYI